MMLSIMKIYLVGGAVRDRLLGLPVKEKDWVVVGATPNDMLQMGFRQVGKDFPVFLHPDSQEEYALARTERKIGLGYTGFEFNTSSTVTLEEDLKRRDVTINAIAETEEGEIIDPFHGQADLKSGILRHVSEAFAEDPVRILRVGRFAARFNFKIAPETIELMKQMVNQGEVNALVPERVWKELERSLLEKYPENFFETLKKCGADQILFPNVNLHALKVAAQRNEIGEVRFAVLFHELSETEIKKICEGYRVPNSYSELALLLCKFLAQYQQIKTLDAEAILTFLMRADAFRREARFINLLNALEICSKESHSHFIKKCLEAANAITIDLVKEKKGADIGNEIKKLRIEAIEKIHK